MRKIVTDREKIELFLKHNPDFKSYDKYTVAKGLIFSFDKFGVLVRIRKASYRALADLERNAFRIRKREEGMKVKRKAEIVE